ncbi:MAG: VOC family protein [Promethearchaeota archaeon]
MEQLVLKYESAGIFVTNMAISKNFYANILGQQIIEDLERYVVFKGGFFIWEQKYALNTIYTSKIGEIQVGRNNCEFYFETPDIEGYYKKIKKEDIEIIHDIIEHPWGQKGFRVYDPDHHIIEIGEPMSFVILRFRQQGMTSEEISKKTLMSLEVIKEILENQGK